MPKRTPVFRRKRLDDVDLAAAPSVAPAILAVLASLGGLCGLLGELGICATAHTRPPDVIRRACSDLERARTCLLNRPGLGIEVDGAKVERNHRFISSAASS
jgi:hypothetical protein